MSVLVKRGADVEIYLIVHAGFRCLPIVIGAQEASELEELLPIR